MTVGAAEGELVGWAVGDAVGELVGVTVGAEEGVTVGVAEGAEVGWAVGDAVGAAVGIAVGLGLVQLHVCTSGSVNSALAEGQPKPAHVTPGSFWHLNLFRARFEIKQVCRFGQLCVAGDVQW